jgi:hypothetical protein
MPAKVLGQDSGEIHHSSKAKAQPQRILLLLFAVLFPAIVAFGILYREAPSVPYQDDYGAILAFAADYQQLPTAQAKVLDIATKQSNEYKLGFEHFVVASELELTRHLNFAFLTALGNLFLLLIGYLLWLTYRKDEGPLARRLLEFLPISLFFFALSYWENLDWAMTGLQNIPVVFFSLLAIYFLTPRKVSEPGRTHLLLACLAAALAAFSSANGFLLGPVGLLILLPRRAYAKSLAWCASFLLPLAAYLYHYTPTGHPYHKFFYLTRPIFFLAFLGCVIPFRFLAAMLGTLLFIIFLLSVRSRYHRTHPAAFYFAVWVVATGFLVAWVRGAVAFTIASRYSIYSNLMLIFCYAFLAHYLPGRSSIFSRRRLYVSSVVIAAFICLMADLNAYKKLEARRRMILSGIEWYRARPEVNSPMVDPLVEQVIPEEKAAEKAILTQAIQKRIYSLPPKQEIR